VQLHKLEVSFATLQRLYLLMMRWWRRLSHKTATVAVFCNSVDRAWASSQYYAECADKKCTISVWGVMPSSSC